MPTSYDPTQPLLDPDIQAALEQGRQAQLASLLGQQRQAAVPHNLGEGIASLGPALLNGLAMMQAKNASAANNASMATALSGAQPVPFLGGPSAMTPMATPMATAPAAGPPLADASSTPPGSLTPVQQQIADTWRKAGANNTAIAGVLGNVQQESSFNPSLNPNREGSGGLYQHLGQRRQDLLAYGDPSPAGQSEFSVSELGGPNAPQLSIDKLNSAQSPAQAASMFMSGFERPKAGPTANESGRRNYANKFASMLGDSEPSPDQIAANIGPASHQIAPGQVAGPGVPSALPMPIQRPPGLQQAAVQIPPNATAPAPPEEEEAPPPPPQAAGPSMLSPTPMGPPQGLAPQGVPPQAAQGAGPPQPQAAPPPVAPPPTAVAGGAPQQGAAPPGTHWAHLPGPPLLLAGDEGGGAPQQGGGGLLAQLFGGGQPGRAPQIRAPQGMAAGLAQQGQQAAPPPQGGMAAGLAPQGGQAPPPSNGLAAGLGGQQPAPPQQTSAPASGAMSGNQAVYQQMYNSAAGPAAKLQHAAAIAAASGNQALATEYERQAAPYAAEMNKANELAVAERTEKPQLFTRNDGSSYLGDPRTGQPIAQISPAKPADRPLTDQEAKAYGIPDPAGYAMNSQTGLPTQIKGTEAADTSQIKNYQFYVKNFQPTADQPQPAPFEQFKQGAEGEHVLAPNSEVVRGGKVVIKNEMGAGLSPDAVNELATRAIGGDNSGMTGLGRGAQGAQNLVAVQNRVAQLAQEKGIDPAGIQDNIAEFYGQKAGARTVGNIGAKLEVFGNSAANALDMASQRSSELPRSQWMPVNQVVQAAQKAGSDPRLAVLNAATETAVNEYTRAVGGTGASTDTAKQHAYDMLNAAQSPEAFNSVVNGLKWEVQNLHNAAKGVAGGLRKGTGGSAEPPPLTIPPGPGATPQPPAAAPMAPVQNVAPNITGAPPATRRGTYVPGKGIVFQ